MTYLVETLKGVGIAESVSGVLLDRVVLALAAMLLALALYDPAQAHESILFTLDAALGIAPFFALAILFAGYARASGLDGVIARAFSGNLALSVVAAAFMGALSPFCSCGVIPLIAALLAAGVPLPAVMAFWIASPIMDPEMFILTAAGIGLNFAIAKTVAAIALGLFAGFATLAIQRAGYLENVLLQQTSCGSCCEAMPDAGVTWMFWKERTRIGAFLGEIGSNGWFLGKWLMLAFFLESLMVAYVPSSFIVSAVGPESGLAVLIAAFVGMPSYLNGYAAIPLVAGLMKLGMTPGAGLAFMTAGAVSSVPAAIAVYALVRKPVFMLYIALGVTGSILAGYAYTLGLTAS